MDQPETSSHGCRNALLVGCGILSLLVVAAVTLVAVNFDRIRESFGRVASEVKESLAEVMELQKKLAQEYGTTAISVNKNFGPGGTSLVVEFMNPPFLDMEEAKLEEKAKEIARFARDNYGPVDGLDGITVVFTTKRSLGISFSSRRSYKFSMEDLVEPEPDEDEPGERIRAGNPRGPFKGARAGGRDRWEMAG